MAQIKPEYEPIDEFKAIALKIVDRFPDVFNGVNANEIRAVGITNKEPKEGKDIFEIRPVPMPIRMDCPYGYYAVCHLADWVTMDREHQQVEVFRVLCSISPDNDGKVIPFDLKDHAVVLRTFGVDYRKGSVPDLLADGFQLKKD